MKYFLIAGEASGDLHASHLMRAIKERDPEAEFKFFGGDAMASVGGELLLHYREMAFMGFITVIRNIRPILNNMRLCKSEIRRFDPDVVIPVDYPGFNLKIAEFVKSELHKPVYYYISPKIWAWKEGRIKRIKRDVDRIFSILPFEVDYFKKHEYSVDYVGNPSLDEVKQFLSKENESEHKIVRDKPIIAILCGSRKHEIRDNLPQMLEAALAFPDYHPIIAAAPSIDKEFYDNIIGDRAVEILFNKTYTVLNSAHAALVTSGTATLECALFGTPQAVVYFVPGGKIVYKAYRSFLKVYWVSLVNLIADKGVVRELLGYKASAKNIKDELELLLLDDNYRKEMIDGYDLMRKKIGENKAPDRAAEMITSLLRK
ncbi:MAG: lipid-A-disaccharide synthase [Bacteroidales bacterium]